MIDNRIGYFIGFDSSMGNDYTIYSSPCRRCDLILNARTKELIEHRIFQHMEKIHGVINPSL